MSVFAFLLLILSAGFPAATQSPGSSQFGANNYTEYVAGNLPIILSLPHGGYLEPLVIPDRSCGTNVKDAYTLELALEISRNIYQITGCYPHMVINHLHRKKLDPNREEDIATCGNPVSRIAYEEYHGFLNQARNMVSDQFTKGLLIDIHGHAHTIQRLELGYLLGGSTLRQDNDRLNHPDVVQLSSIRNLAFNNPNSLSHAELIRGTFSLGTYFEAEGHASVPAYHTPFPLANEPYFSGGYITLVHGSSDAGTIDAIQIECHQTVRFTQEARNSFAASFARVLLDYLAKHYFPEYPRELCRVLTNESPLQDRSQMIHPVPACRYIFTESSADAKGYSIIRADGGVAKTISGFAKELYIGDLPDGLYILKTLGNGAGSGYAKFVKTCR